MFAMMHRRSALCVLLLGSVDALLPLTSWAARRAFLGAASATTAGLVGSSSRATAASPQDLQFKEAVSGLQWADVKVGSGEAPKKGTRVIIDCGLHTH